MAVNLYVKKKKLVIDISEVKHTEIKTLASSMGISIKEFVDEAIKRYIEYLKNGDEIA